MVHNTKYLTPKGYTVAVFTRENGYTVDTLDHEFYKGYLSTFGPFPVEQDAQAMLDKLADILHLPIEGNQ